MYALCTCVHGIYSYMHMCVKSHTFLFFFCGGQRWSNSENFISAVTNEYIRTYQYGLVESELLKLVLNLGIEQPFPGVHHWKQCNVLALQVLTALNWSYEGAMK